MPLDSVIYSEPSPINSWGSQQNSPYPPIHDSDYAKTCQQHPASFQYPTLPILIERPTSPHNTVDRRWASLFDPVSFSTCIPDPHQPNPSPHPPRIYLPPDAVADSSSRHIKIYVSIDFGAAYSSASYATSTSREVRQIPASPGSGHSFSKIPTCLVYDDLGDIRAWGVEAKDMILKKGWVRSEWFKLWLDPNSAPGSVLEFRSFQPPKNAMDVVADYLACLWAHTKSQIHKENSPCSLSHAEVYLTVPSSWDLHASLLLRGAAIKAWLYYPCRSRAQLMACYRGLVVQAQSEDPYWQERLHIIPATEASVIHFALSPEFKFQQDQVLTICDAGGATIDLATYYVLRALGSPEIAEAVPRSGSYCGSLFLDLRFRELVQAQKSAYQGPEDDTKLFRFRCLHAEDLHDAAVGLDHGELVIPGDVLRREVFGPVVEQILHSIASHLQASNLGSDVLLLVGGFSTNDYLFRRITEQFSSSVVSIIRPARGENALCHGGARFGIGSLVSSIIQPQNLFRRVALPAERDDRMMRPVYITNVAGRSLCECRVEYIIRRGASFMKGGRSELRLRKHCSSRYDRTFELVLYTSSGNQKRRYFDQEQGEELCLYRVDLGTYPNFLEQVETSLFGDFYVDFVLGFEMDSAGRIMITLPLIQMLSN
ncbi:hypothetical protein BS47DRAFT_1396058 [Hydnum rufescens UP504]|uniref:Actin-like ATPase domain-containing protein n=1 Tax=Hydnum rufescens UP504 TaxID=1448309 RepID=A0A9P6DPR1_9AGAM|nr:hypothetical protein BS47DRAFT_1396058 [Hydnum rufescens UP504]